MSRSETGPGEAPDRTGLVLAALILVAAVANLNLSRARVSSNAAICESLVLTKGAVEKHINSIFLKLDLAFTEDVSKRVKAALIYLSAAEGP